ncbi:DUF1189 family protein [Ureibacillus manganicus]|uniref:4-hydroxy-3-methylbut-2-en-1-yl diphosphate synthase n=1 Tax=Ureibacillus manganicus DSM 26584 TaxID=1384049 RepID=A0A0A3I0Y2_9BACL|nr:DUF1189 family protein [Ureibacillus manganicus]KGR78496.1 4-hydroxy-3-methylbut-2-en-1-yl diphosphate synthase [Ureibacillus manganicus DSM 26584]
MVKHSQLFLDGLFHPKKLAGYRMLSIGKVIQYVFILTTLVTIFYYIQYITGVSNENSFDIEGFTQYVKEIQWLLYPFALFILFLTTTTIFLIQISIFALVGTGLLKVMKKRGEYRHMWRSSALAITWPALLSILFPFLPIHNLIGTLLGILVTILLLIIAATKYPKLPVK